MIPPPTPPYTDHLAYLTLLGTPACVLRVLFTCGARRLAHWEALILGNRVPWTQQPP